MLDRSFELTSPLASRREAHSARKDQRTVPEMVFLLDALGTYIGYTPGAGIDPWGPPEVFLGQSVTQILPSPVGELVMNSIDLATATRELQTIQYELCEEDIVRKYHCYLAAIDPETILAVVMLSRPTLLAEEGNKLLNLVELEVCARAAFAGKNRFSLTVREFMVLGLVIEGMADKEIAGLLGCATSTVNKHVSSIMTKVDAKSRTEAAVRALRQHLLPLLPARDC